MSNSTKRPAKPKKPHPDFPLFPHATGRWAKKVRGKMCYFGKWNDPQAALAKWLEQKDDLLAGRKPRSKNSGPTVRDVANKFMESRLARLEAGELSQKTHDDYETTCKRFVDLFRLERPVDDLRPEDFSRLRMLLAKTNGPVAIGNQISKTRTVFKHAYESGLIDKPIRFGADFKRPSASVLRKERVRRGSKMFEASDIWKIHAASNTAIKAMVFLGINAALGNADCGRLEQSHLDLATGWLNFPRPKTGVGRRCPLWPETVEAIHAALKVRPTPGDDKLDNRIFITPRGQAWVNETSDSPVSQVFTKVIKKVGVYRKGLGFYCLRHTFRTIADETRDFPAIDLIMGHAAASNDMANRYRERIDDARLLTVSNYVRDWLFSEDK